MSRHEGALMSHRTFILIALMSFLPLVLFAQPESNGASSQAVMPFGSGQRTSLQYANKQAPENALMLDTGYQATYDDNVIGVSGAARRGDEEQGFGAHLTVLRQSPKLSAFIEYSPSYEFYEELREYNRFDQYLGADMELKLSSRWSLRVRDVFDDQSNPYQTELNSATENGLGSPSTLNSTIYVHLAAQQSNSARADLLWQANARNSAYLFAGYEFRNYTGVHAQSQSLTDTRGDSAGAEYAWRASEHATLGALYLFQHFDLSGTLPAGSPSRLDLHGVLPSLGWRPRPSVAITAFAGPQVVIQTMAPTAAASSPASLPSQVEWAGGGTIYRQMDRTAWFLSAQRMVNDGGGLMAYVISSTFNAGFHQRVPLPGRWDATWQIALTQNRGLKGSNGAENLTEQSAGFNLEHPFRSNLTARLMYDFARQNRTEMLPVGAAFHRNRVSLGIYFRWGTFPLGH